MSSADLTASLGGFHEIGDYLRDREVTLALKDATAAWLSLAQVCQVFHSGMRMFSNYKKFIKLSIYISLVYCCLL